MDGRASKHSTHTPNHLCLHLPICSSTAFNSVTHPHLYQHVGCIMETHDQSSHSCHVVHIGKGDEGDCCHMVQKHDQEILGTQLPRKCLTITESTFKTTSQLFESRMQYKPRAVKRRDKVRGT